MLHVSQSFSGALGSGFLKNCVYGLVIFTAFPAIAQEGDASSESDPKKLALVSFVNACSTDLEERWRASIDVFFKGVPLCQDVRIGESSLLQEVEMDGQGLIEIRKHGSAKVLASVPANLRAKTFNTVILTGEVGESSSLVKPVFLRDFPLNEKQQRPSFARLVVVSGITRYPAKVTIGGEVFAGLAAGVAREVFVRPGEKEIKMFFSNAKLGAGEFNTKSGLLAEAGSTYNVIFMDSPRMPGRPRVLVLDVSMQRKEFLEALKAAKEEQEQSEGSEGDSLSGSL